VVILVGKHQTKDIYEGLKESGFDMDHVHVFDHVHQAFDYVQRNASIHDMILLENDLPDAFNR
jgi:UDP-N-acetylmuramyl pentapeptide synthase